MKSLLVMPKQGELLTVASMPAVPFTFIWQACKTLQGGTLLRRPKWGPAWSMQLQVHSSRVHAVLTAITGVYPA